MGKVPISSTKLSRKEQWQATDKVNTGESNVQQIEKHPPIFIHTPCFCLLYFYSTVLQPLVLLDLKLPLNPYPLVDTVVVCSGVKREPHQEEDELNCCLDDERSIFHPSVIHNQARLKGKLVA